MRGPRVITAPQHRCTNATGDRVPSLAGTVVRKFRVVNLVPTRREHLLVLLASLALACTRLVGVPLADASADAGSDAGSDAGQVVCPPAVPGHTAGEPDRTLLDLVDSRIARFFIKGAGQDALGRVYVCGALRGCSGAPELVDAAVMRLTDDGVLDPTFGDNGIACTVREPRDRMNQSAFALAVDEHGRVVLAGHYYLDAEQPQRGVMVARFGEDGAPDEGIGAQGFHRYVAALTPGAPGSTAFFVLPEADGIVLTGGERDVSDLSSYGFVMRLLDDGTPDPGFHHGEPWFDVGAWSLSRAVRTAEGYVVAGASRPAYSPRVVMLGRDGELVRGFGPGGTATHTQRNLMVRALEVDARGGFVLAGEVRGAGSAGMVRFHPDGRPDQDFGLDEGLAMLGVPWDSGRQLAPALARQCDGRLLIAGGAGGGEFTLARVGADGRRDARFGVEGFARGGRMGFSIHVYGTLVNPLDGRVTVVTSVFDDRDVAIWRFWP